LQAEILSERAEEELADNPVGYLLAATPDEVYNALVCTRLAPELGRERVYQLAHEEGHLLDPTEGVQRDWRGKVLAGRDLHFGTLEQHYRQGWRFQVVEDVDGSAPDPGLGVIVMALRKSGRLDLASPDDPPVSVTDGERIVVFAPPESAASDQEQRLRASA
jgi:hypothetical protein